MRRRLVLSTLAAVGVVLVLLGLPLAVAVRTLLVSSALDGLQREVEQAERFLDRRAGSLAEAVVLLQLLAEERSVRYTLLDEGDEVVADTGGAPAGAAVDAPDARLAAQGRVGRVAEGGVLAVSVRVTSTDLVLRGAVVDDELAAAVRRSWLALAGLAVTASAVATLLALRQGERFAAPLEALADSARRLGDGDFSVRAPRSAVPEVDDVAAALDSTAERLGAVLERSRSFSADASHQLRTPLTALRLDLEALEATGADHELVAAAVAEADRLESTIAELLTLAEPAGGTELVDLSALAEQRLDAWRALARASGREVVLRATPAPAVRARAAALGQALQVLLDNALEHGAGTITVSVQPVAGGARLCVADEGRGMPPGREILPPPADGGGVAVPLRGGRGLPLARALVEAEGGRIRIERARPGAMLCLVLPAADVPSPVGPPDHDAALLSELGAAPVGKRP